MLPKSFDKWWANRDKLKIVFVDKPMQDENSTNPQLIDNKRYKWVLESMILKGEETLQEWLVREEDKLRLPKFNSVIGILILDIRPLISVPYEGKQRVSMMVRFGYLKITDEIIV